MNIFKYNDGTKDRYGDPMRIERLLEAHAHSSGELGSDLQTLLKRTISENPDISDPATECLKTAICKAFELVPFDPKTGQGCTEDFVLSLFDQFAEWREKKNQPTDSAPKSPTPTAGKPAVPLAQTVPPKKTASTASG